MSKNQYVLMLVVALIAGLVGGVVSSQFLVGQAALASKEKAWPAKKVEANTIQLLDKNGSERLILSGAPSPLLRFRNSAGGDVMLFGLGYTTGRPRLLLLDEQLLTRISFLLQENGQPSLEFYGLNDQPGVVLKLDAGGNPILTLSDKKGKARAKLSLDGEEGKPNLTLLDKDGKIIWKAP
jgi:hypothetical protein